MKKILYFIAAILLCTSALPGCQKDKKVQDDDEPSAVDRYCRVCKKVIEEYNRATYAWEIDVIKDQYEEKLDKAKDKIEFDKISDKELEKYKAKKREMEEAASAAYIRLSANDTEEAEEDYGSAYDPYWSSYDNDYSGYDEPWDEVLSPVSAIYDFIDECIAAINAAENLEELQAATMAFEEFDPGFEFEDLSEHQQEKVQEKLLELQEALMDKYVQFAE